MPFHFETCPNSTRSDEEVDCDCAEVLSNNDFHNKLLKAVFDAQIVEIIFLDVIN